MKNVFYIFSSGVLKRKNNTICFESNENKVYIPIESISDIYVFGEVDLNKRVLEFFCENEIVLHFFNCYEYYVGSFYPREHNLSGYTTIKQVECYLDLQKRLDLAKRFVIGAVRNMQVVLSYYARKKDEKLKFTLQKLREYEDKIIEQKSIESLMALEGNVREIYYDTFNVIIENENFEFIRRSKRPPENRLNALISFGNSLLYTLVLSEIYKTRLDPRIGYLHSTNLRKFTLNLDVSEIFKPILVDRTIFSLLNKKQINANHFVENTNGVFLSERGMKTFVSEWDERLRSTIQHPKLNRKVSYRELIRLELYKIEKHIIEDEPYEPFVGRI